MFSKRTGWKLAANRLAQAQQEVRSAGMDVLDLTLSNPTRAGFPYDSEAILNALGRPEALEYDPQPCGFPEHSRFMESWLDARSGLCAWPIPLRDG